MRELGIIKDLRELIIVCKQTDNYEKVADVAYTLLCNRANEIGIRLGTKPLLVESIEDKDSKRNVHSYLTSINSIFDEYFSIKLFNPSLLAEIARAESLYRKAKLHSAFTLSQAKSLLALYFMLENLEVPNLLSRIDEDALEGFGELNLFSKFLANDNGKERTHGKNPSEQDNLKTIFKYNLEQKKRALRRKVQEHYDPNLIEEILLTEQISRSLNRGNGKVRVKGPLAEGIPFEKSGRSICGYFILGIALLMLGFGIIFIADGVYNPHIFGRISVLMLLCFISGAVFLYIYKTYFMKHDYTR